MKALVSSLPLFVGSIAALWSITPPAQAQNYTWNSPVNGNWSDTSNWLGNVSPLAGGGPNVAIKFAPKVGIIRSLSSINDLGASFLVNAFEIDIPISLSLSVSSSGSNAVTFSGSNSRITHNGPGRVTLSKVTFGAADGVTTINGNGSGDIVLNSLEGLSTGDTLRIAVGPQSPSGQIVYAKINATGGTVQLDSGNLSLDYWPNNASTTLRINGGTVRIGSGSNPIINSPIQLGTSLVLLDPNNTTIASPITALNPTAGLQLRATGDAVTLTGVSTYTAPTVVDVGFTSPNPGNPAGMLRLAGAGSILNTSELDIRAGGTLAIETAPTGVTNRVGDSTPLILRGGRLVIYVPSASAGVQSERVGPISISGSAVIAADLTVNRSVDLTAASLTRLQRGTVVFRSPTLATLGPNPARILFTAPPALVGGAGSGVNTSIIPYAVGDDLVGGGWVGAGFVTYTAATGVRLLNTATEYASSLAEATPQSNLRTTVSTSLSEDVTVNSLFLAKDSSLIDGSSTLTINSGAILAILNYTPGTFGTATIKPTINLGSAEGHIVAASDIVFQGPISGSNGVTKSGFGTVTFQADNPFTGPLTINDGKISFDTMAQLGADTGAVTMGDNGGLRYTGPGTLTFNRPIELLSGYATLDSTAGVLNLTQPIFGPGGLRLTIPGTVRLSAANTYQGSTSVAFGTLEFANDSALGSGALSIDSTVWPTSGVRLLGDWTTSRTVQTFGGTIDTNGFNATLNGQLVGSDISPPLKKRGAGTLTITKTVNTAGLKVEGGTVSLSDRAYLGRGGIDISSSGTLVLNETGAPEGRLDSSSDVTLGNGALRVIGDAVSPSREKIRHLGIFATTANTLELVRPGTASLSFNAVTLTRHESGPGSGPAGSSLIVKADNLGGPAGSPYTRLIVDNPPKANAGILTGIYAAPNSGTGQESLTKYVQGSDSAGPIGVTPLAAADYTNGPILQHSDGTANFLVQPGTAAGGSNNSVNTLTFESGSTLTQASNQQLVVQDQMLVRSGASSSLTGGSLEVATLIGFGDIALNMALVGSMQKIGPGALVFTDESALELELSSASSYDRLKANIITFEGTVALALTLNYDPVDFVDSFTLLQAGTLTIEDGAPPELFSYMGNSLSQGEFFFIGAQEFQMNYSSGDGNDVAIQAVPEPASALSAGVALSLLLGLRRRRSHQSLNRAVHVGRYPGPLASDVTLHSAIPGISATV